MGNGHDSSIVGWDDLSGWASQLDSRQRGRLADALRDVERADRKRAIVDSIRRVLARDETEREPVVVVFGNGGWERDYLDQLADVLYADGSREEIDFGDVAGDLLAVEFGEVIKRFGLSVDLRTGEVATDDIDTLFTRHGFPQAEQE